MQELDKLESQLEPMKVSMDKMLESLKDDWGFFVKQMGERMQVSGDTLLNSVDIETEEEYNDFAQAIFEFYGMMHVLEFYKDEIRKTDVKN